MCMATLQQCAASRHVHEEMHFCWHTATLNDPQIFTLKAPRLLCKQRGGPQHILACVVFSSTLEFMLHLSDVSFYLTRELVRASSTLRSALLRNSAGPAPRVCLPIASVTNVGSKMHALWPSYSVMRARGRRWCSAERSAAAASTGCH